MMIDEWTDLRERLLFRVSIGGFAAEWCSILDTYRRIHRSATLERQQEIERLIAELAIDLQSYLTRWHLQAPENPDRLDDAALAGAVEGLYALLDEWGAAAAAAQARREAAALQASNLRRLSAMADVGQLNTRWGHDYASGVAASMRKGAILVTTNPPLIDKARLEDPLIWDAVKAELRQKHPGATPQRLVSHFTMRVVLRNCRTLRPIFDATGGRLGYVNLQVNPHHAAAPDRMIEEAEDLHEALTYELNGRPNVVFKVPGTKESLPVVSHLTAKGIGVSITVSFALDQHLAFGEAIEQGNAAVSYIVQMSGRLDDPIRDELAQLGVPDAAETAKCASTAIIRRSYDQLYGLRNYRRSFLLVASLRGPWNIEAAVTDGAHPILITSFPDKTAEYDARERPILSRMREPIPESVMRGLRRSSLFRQAHEAGGLTPEGFNTFLPVVRTLDEFAGAYDRVTEYLTA